MLQVIQHIGRLSFIPLFVYALAHWQGFILQPLRVLRWMAVFLAASELISYVSLVLQGNNMVLFGWYTIGEMFFVIQILIGLKYSPTLQKVYYLLFAAFAVYMLWAVYSSPAYPTQARLLQVVFLLAISIFAQVQWVKLGLFGVWQLGIILAFQARFLFIVFSHLGFIFLPELTILNWYVLQDLMNIFSNLLLLFALFFYLNQHKFYPS